MQNRLIRTTAFTALMLLPSVVSAQEVDLEAVPVPQITVFAAADAYDTLPGSGTFLSPKDLSKFEDSDINAMLEEVPGLYVQEEDGFGLRPNIGMRAALSDRSAKITVMEDGILIAPAPYAQPAAYYFPRASRMHAVEVVKGPAAIRFGPYTTGGAINLISTPIPTDSKGVANVRAGSNGQADLHLHYGATSGNWGYLVETLQERNEGFKTLPNGDDTGYDIGAFLGKLRYSPDAGNQSFELKYEYTDEVSDETYYGLTDADFAANPFQRYAGTQQDEMDNEHWQTVLTHHYEFQSGASLKTQIYQTWFDRNWYKLSKVGGSGFSTAVDDAAKFAVLKGGDSDAACLAAPNTANCSTTDLAVKANNRAYQAEGIQTQLNFEAGIHSVEIGYRVHEDEMTRVQWEDDYYMSGGQMVRYQAGVPGATGGSNNRFEKAEATSIYLQDEMDFGALTLTPGVRHEDIEGRREARLTGVVEKDTAYSETLYGVSASYELNDNIILIAGIHDGFSATGVANSEGETSQNYELGARYIKDDTLVEAIFFFTDFDNLVATCTAASGCAAIGDTYNGGAVEIMGLELAASRMIELGGLNFPTSLTYTFTDTEFQTSFEADLYELWGSVSAGDELPYVPEHQIGLNIGTTVAHWELTSRMKYKSEQRVTAGSGPIAASDKIGSAFVTDLSASRALNDRTSLNIYINNAFDKEYEVSRHPDGLRPGAPRTVAIGVTSNF